MLHKGTYRRTKTIICAGKENPLPFNELKALEQLDYEHGKECCFLRSFYLEMVGNEGRVDLSINAHIGNLAYRKDLAINAIAYLQAARLPGVFRICNDGSLVRLFFRIKFWSRFGKRKDKAAMDLYIKIFETLRFAHEDKEIIPEPRIGRFTEISADHERWTDYGSSLLQERLAQCKR